MVTQENQIVASIDIGTTKVCAVIGKINTDQTLEIIGAGSSVSQGVAKGIVIDALAVSKAVRRAVIRAENICGLSISSALANISGAYLKTIVKEANINFPSRKLNRISSVKEINECLKKIPLDLKEGEEIVQIFPKSFRINGGEWINNPLGKTANHLTVKAVLIKGEKLPLINLTETFAQSKIKLKALIPNSLAASEVILSPQDREEKTLLIDFGGGTTDVISFSQGAIENIFSLGLGGNHLTYDIACGMDISFTEAERLKILYGECRSMAKDEETIEVVDRKPQQEPKRISRRFLSEIIDARCREIFNLIKVNLSSPHYKKIMVIGGSAQLSNLKVLAEEIFDNAEIKLGIPPEKKEIIETPIYAVSIGSIFYALRNDLIRPQKNGFWIRIKNNLRNWLEDFF